jgi:hypothetical protein
MWQNARKYPSGMKRPKILLLLPEAPLGFRNLSDALKFFGKRACSPPLGKPVRLMLRSTGPSRKS